MRGLPKIVKAHLAKARDSALLAVEVYNKPAVEFKSAAYIVLMVIAWTALFHAICFKNRQKPYYRDNKKPRQFSKRDGDYKHWELGTCLDDYYKSDSENPVRKNLELFVLLRNQIEHRHVPELDATLFGECQAMLLNFDEMIEKEFGSRYCIRESLSFALQMFPRSDNLVEAVKRNPAANAAMRLIENYRSTISADVHASGNYSFKAFLIKVASNSSNDSLPIQFVNYDHLTEEQREGLLKFTAMIKEKPFPLSNVHTLRAGVVTAKVQNGLGQPKITRPSGEVDRFNIDTHSRCWKKYGVRPKGGSPSPKMTNAKYCVYDTAHSDYVYTQEWVDFLIEKMSDEDEYQSLYRKNQIGVVDMET